MNAPDRTTFAPAVKDATLFRDRAYIDGAWCEADSGKRFDVDNPGDGSLVGSVPDMSTAETRRAIEAAERALPAWRALPAKEPVKEPETREPIKVNVNKPKPKAQPAASAGQVSTGGRQ